MGLPWFELTGSWLLSSHQASLGGSRNNKSGEVFCATTRTRPGAGSVREEGQFASCYTGLVAWLCARLHVHAPSMMVAQGRRVFPSAYTNSGFDPQAGSRRVRRPDACPHS